MRRNVQFRYAKARCERFRRHHRAGAESELGPRLTVLPREDVIGRPPVVVFGADHTGPNRRVVPEQALRVFQRDRPEDHEIEQRVGGRDLSGRAQFPLLAKLFDVSLVSGEQHLTIVRLCFPRITSVEHAERMHLHAVGRFRIERVQPEVLDADPRRPLPRVHVDRVAMFEDGRVLFGDGLRRTTANWS